MDPLYPHSISVAVGLSPPEAKLLHTVEGHVLPISDSVCLPVYETAVYGRTCLLEKVDLAQAAAQQLVLQMRLFVPVQHTLISTYNQKVV